MGVSAKHTHLSSPQVKVRFQAQCNYSWECQFDINVASRNSLIGLSGESEPENILTFLGVKSIFCLIRSLSNNI